mgnify:CR=1 FL=1
MVDEAQRHRRGTKPHTILVIEDDGDIARLLELHLHDAGYDVHVVQDGAIGCKQALSKSYDLIILDLMLPGMDGLDICHVLRTKPNYTPVLMLTAKSTELDRVLGLEVGADDYLTKPFSFEELTARIKALLRRPKRIEDTIYKFKGISLNTQTNQVFHNNRRVFFTKKEFILLALLMKEAGKVVSRATIFEKVWDMNGDPFSNTIETHILNIRNKLGDRGKRLIQNVPGFGYKISV